MTFSFDAIVDRGDAFEHFADHGNLFQVEDLVVAKIGRKVVAARREGVHTSSGDCELGLCPG